MASNIFQEVAALKLSFIIEGVQLHPELSGMLLSDARNKECGLKFIHGCMVIMSLAKLVNACFSKGLCHKCLGFSIKHG